VRTILVLMCVAVLAALGACDKARTEINPARVEYEERTRSIPAPPAAPGEVQGPPHIIERSVKATSTGASGTASGDAGQLNLNPRPPELRGVGSPAGFGSAGGGDFASAWAKVTFDGWKIWVALGALASIAGAAWLAYRRRFRPAAIAGLVAVVLFGVVINPVVAIIALIVACLGVLGVWWWSERDGLAMSVKSDELFESLRAAVGAIWLSPPNVKETAEAKLREQSTLPTDAEWISRVIETDKLDVDAAEIKAAAARDL
jgi:hypothetical protein